MAKGQKRSNREPKKPKQKKQEPSIAMQAVNNEPPIAIGMQKKKKKK